MSRLGLSTRWGFPATSRLSYRLGRTPKRVFPSTPADCEATAFAARLAADRSRDPTGSSLPGCNATRSTMARTIRFSGLLARTRASATRWILPSNRVNTEDLYWIKVPTCPFAPVHSALLTFNPAFGNDKSDPPLPKGAPLTIGYGSRH